MTTRHYILLAEDDREEAFLVHWAFRRAGLPHQIIDVRDGEATIKYLKGMPPFNDRLRYPPPRLLLLDLKMPKVNGFDVLAWLKTHREFNSLPAIVLSSSDFHADLKKARDLGAKEFLTKPHELEDLVRLVGGVHERWLTGEQPDSAIVTSLAQGTARTEVESQMLPMSPSAT